jgi:O-antigen/teichoic acid export membrane protein
VTLRATLQDRGLLARLGSGLGWSFVGSAFNQGSTFVLNVVLARLWTLTLFGEYSMVYATVLASSTIAQLAMGYTATRYLAETRTSDRAKAGRILVLTGAFAVAAAVVGALLLLAAAPWIATAILARPALAPAVRIAAAALAFLVACGFVSGALAGLEAFRRVARSGVASGIFFVAACAGGAWHAGVRGALWGLSLSGLFQLLVLGWHLRREIAAQAIPIHWRGALAERSLIWRFSLPAALGSIIAMIAFWLANATLARQPRGYEALALFTAANNVRAGVLFIPAILNSVGMSVLNAERGERNERSYRRVFWMNLLLTSSIVFGVVVLVLALGPVLLKVFGGAYVAGYPILAVLMAAAVAEALVLAVYQLIQSQERIWTSLAAVVIPRDLTILGLAYVLSPRTGAVGLATAYAAGWAVALGSVAVLALRLGLRLPDRPDRDAGGTRRS